MCHSKDIDAVVSGYTPPRRDFRRVFKPRLPRKVTSSARINLNRFWNELEDFYSRYDDRRAKNNNNSQSIIIPPYTTDAFDHRREEAENRLNEQLEAGKDIDTSDSSGYLSDNEANDLGSESSDDNLDMSGVTVSWNTLSPSPRIIPSSLLDLAKKMLHSKRGEAAAAK